MKNKTLVSALITGSLCIGMGIPAIAATTGSQQNQTTTTSSYSNTRGYIDNVTNIQKYVTQVLGLATWEGPAAGEGFDNRQVYSQTFNSARGSEEVQRAYNEARNAVQDTLESTGGRGQIQLNDSITVRETVSTSVETSESVVATQTYEIQVGPGTLIIGDRDAANPSVFNIGPGGTNINEHTNYHTTVQRDVTNEHTDRTTWTVNGSLYSSPIILDMANIGGIEASGGKWQPHGKEFHAKHRALFDFFGNGFPVAMEWVGPNDGLLVVPKADGSVDGTCLFGNANGYAHGYEHLATLDQNLDGRVEGRELQGLSIWQDKNGNAKADAGELHTVQSLGITSLDLRHKGFKSSFTMKGKTQAMFDWWPTMLELKKTKQAI